MLLGKTALAAMSVDEMEEGEPGGNGGKQGRRQVARNARAIGHIGGWEGVGKGLKMQSRQEEVTNA